MKRTITIIGGLTLLAVLIMPLVSICAYAQTNTMVVTGSNGQSYTFPIPSTWGLWLGKWGGVIVFLGVIANFILRFLPTPAAGSAMASVVKFLKILNQSTPSHQAADVPVQPTVPPTTNVTGGGVGAGATQIGTTAFPTSVGQN